MNSFSYNSQTAMFFGRFCVERNADFFRKYGKRAVVFTTAFPPGHVNLGLEDMKQTLSKIGVDYLVVDHVYTDPPVEKVCELANEIRGYGADFFVAVGGGSAMDTAKAAALLLKYPDDADPYEVFWGDRKPADSIQSELSIPLFTVPTTAGTGAEATPFAVLTRSDIHTKRTMYHNAYPTAAFLDARYIIGSPKPLLHAGIFDALAHGIESSLHTGSTPMGKMLASFGFSLFKSFKDRLISFDLTDEDYDSMMLAAFVQGLACMQSSTTIPHGLGYPLSYDRGVSHGLACGVFLGEYLKGFKNKDVVEHIVRECGFDNSRDFADYCDLIMKDDIHIEVTYGDIETWTDNFMQTQTVRLETNPEPLAREDIERLYRCSLRRFLKT